MKFLKTKNISKFSISDRTLIVNPYGRIDTNSTNSLQLPVGNDAQRPQPSLAYEGQMRMNTEVLGPGLAEFEVFQAGEWRSVKFKVPSQVTYSALGNGNDVETLFGPLTPTPPATIENGAPWSGAQLMVYVENVFQLFNTNYTVTQNPCNITNNSISFTALTTTITSEGAINFVERGYHPGQTIVITGSGSNDGTYTIASANGSVTATTIVLNEPIVDEAVGAAITVVGRSDLTNLPYPAGFYLNFKEAVPSVGIYGTITVTVITGFDK